MAAPRDRKHIVVAGEPQTENYTPHGKKITPAVPPANPNRPAHGAALAQALVAAQTAAAARRQQAQIHIDGGTPSIYVEFQSVGDVRLELSTLEAQSSGIELVSVRHETVPQPDGTSKTTEWATVIIPDGRIKHFLKRFEAYSKAEEKKKGERRYENMLDRIAGLRLATLRALWTDTGTAFPAEQTARWWEVWLRKFDGGEVERFTAFCAQAHLPLSARRLEFEDRTVVLVLATASQLAISLDVLNDLAELRSVHQPASFFVNLTATGQAEWINDLLNRTTQPPENAPAVCVLDTGVNRGHPLLEASLAVNDVHTCEPGWNAGDHHGHGTEMAGLALYGNLTPLFANAQQIALRHRLESVKILAPQGHATTPPELYGAVTAAATSRAEVAAPQRRRCFSMSVGADPDGERGQPTSWSTAIDALAAGRSFDANKQGLAYIDDPAVAMPMRLFLVSAGNVAPNDFAADFLTHNDLAHIEDPAHAWNAIAVGACTELCTTEDPGYVGWTPLAAAGELSPWSRTSVGFDAYWPNKPDVVFEGGNVLHDGGADYAFEVPDLCLLTTERNQPQHPFASSWATSAACAQVARIAGEIAAEYPELRPEAVRGLIVHSAEWTDAMRKHLAASPGKIGRSALVRRYGFGVPRLERALHSARDALTLLVQGTIKPFEAGKMRQIQLFSLPWPKEQLAALGETGVKLRVTLSYFIEPNPSRRGWRKKHRYQSHGLRFAIKGPAETDDDFHKRLNNQALDPEEEKPEAPEGPGWFLGTRTRDRGSIHSDIWSGLAADLAEREVIAIYPVSGWWKDQPSRDRSDHGARYALIVSIETPVENVDIWTPVAQQVGIHLVV
jgi:hypothetical protein